MMDNAPLSIARSKMRLNAIAAAGTVDENLERIEAISRRANESADYQKDGTGVRMYADSFCLHGDTPNRAAISRAVADALRRHRIGIRAAGART